MPFVEKAANAYFNAVKTPDDLKFDALPYLPPDRDFIKSVETLISSAFLLGIFHASEEQGVSRDAVNAADDTDIPPIPFSEAVGFLKSKLNLFKNFSFGTGYLEIRRSKSCYLCDLELAELFDNNVLEQLQCL